MLRKQIKNLVFTIEGTQYGIVNLLTNSMFYYGKCEGENEKVINDVISDFMESHTIKDKELGENTVKRVIYNPFRKDYEQVQILKSYNDTFIIQYYNSNLEFMEEMETNYKYSFEAIRWLKTIYELIEGFSVEVFKSSYIGDCTNNGISKDKEQLFLIGENLPKISIIKDIRDCLVLDYTINRDYVRCKPLINKDKHYMDGGNFIYSSDSRFAEINKYPIPIHDRVE